MLWSAVVDPNSDFFTITAPVWYGGATYEWPASEQELSRLRTNKHTQSKYTPRLFHTAWTTDAGCSKALVGSSLSGLSVFVVVFVGLLR